MRIPRPSPAMAVALVALILATAGTALSASYVITSSSQIKDGAVTGSDVRNSSLTGSDVKDGSLTGSDVKDRSLSAADFNGSLQGPAGPAGAVGPVGPAGPAGARGDAGPRGPSDLYGARVGAGTIDANSPSWNFLAKRALPATGPYLGLANAIVKNVSAAAKTLECGLSWWSPTGDSDTVRLTLAPDQQAPVTLAGAIVVPSSPPIAPQVDFTCHIVAGYSAGTLEFSDIDIGALQVGALG